MAHIGTGVIALIAGSLSTYASRIFFRIIGILYIFVAGIGFFYGATHILGIITGHPSEIILHGGFALLSLYLGFFVGQKKEG